MSENMGTAGGSAAESMRMSYSHARDAANKVIGQVRDRASTYMQTGRDKAGDVTDQVGTFVREQPIKSVLIAAGAGLLIGFLLRRH